MEEHAYNGSGTLTGSKYYYSLGGRMLGKVNGSGALTFYLSDALGSPLASFSGASGTTTVSSNQNFGPYGNLQYNKGSMGTAKGFTGQYQDDLSNLYNFGARYYDQLVGTFLSADTVQGNLLGMNPYAYVNGNPETNSDPTGHFIITEGDTATLDGAGQQTGQETGSGSGTGSGGDSGPSVTSNTSTSNASNTLSWSTTSGNTVTQYYIDPDTGDTVYQQYRNGMLVGGGDIPDTGGSPRAVNGAVLASLGIKFNFPDPVPGGFSINLAPQALPSTQTGGSGRGNIPPITVSSAAAPCSFTSDTPVTTDHGKEAIGKLHVGDKVLAYNPKTHKMEPQPILHVWTHTDKDLVDVTISYSTPAPHSKGTIQKSEVLHTTSEHPFLTTEQGFTPAGSLKTGMHVLRADGNVGVITGWKVAPGTKVMYNLEVAQDHTFTVGDGQWVVHNRCDRPKLRNNLGLNPGDPRVGQHVIPCALESNLLVQTSGLDINSATNGIIMEPDPTTAQASNQIYHLGSHPAYTEAIESLLNRRLAALQSTSSLNGPNALAAVLDTIRDGRYMIAAFNQIDAASSLIPLKLC